MRQPTDRLVGPGRSHSGAAEDAAPLSSERPPYTRKLSYGTDSEAGARFVERILTVTASLQLQQRNVFAYLATTIDAHFHGQPAPSILPGTSDPG